MQESRRRRRLELGLLSLSAWFVACASQTPEFAAPAPIVSDRAAAERGVRSEAPDAPSAPGALALEATREAVQPAAERDPAEELPAAPPPELPRDTLVLHIGDSFAGALGVALGRRFKAAGVRTMLQYKTASYIPTWASGEDLTRYVSNYNPDLVLVTLGANEFEIPDPAQRIPAIRRLVGKIGQRPCIWISPPRWKADTGLMNVIRANAAPCRFLDSDTLVRELPRARDRIHPSEEGREIWASAVFDWLAQARKPGGDRPWALRDEAPVVTPAATASATARAR